MFEISKSCSSEIPSMFSRWKSTPLSGFGALPDFFVSLRRPFSLSLSLRLSAFENRDLAILDSKCSANPTDCKNAALNFRLWILIISA